MDNVCWYFPLSRMYMLCEADGTVNVISLVESACHVYWGWRDSRTGCCLLLEAISWDKKYENPMANFLVNNLNLIFTKSGPIWITNKTSRKPWLQRLLLHYKIIYLKHWCVGKIVYKVFGNIFNMECNLLALKQHKTKHPLYILIFIVFPSKFL